MWTERLAIKVKRVYRDFRAVLKPQTARAVWAAQMAYRVDVVGILHAERHRLRQPVVGSLNTASNASALGAYEVAPNVAAGQSMSEIVHGYSTTPRALSA
jgi:hypothetical protein